MNTKTKTEFFRPTLKQYSLSLGFAMAMLSPNTAYSKPITKDAQPHIEAEHDCSFDSNLLEFELSNQGQATERLEFEARLQKKLIENRAKPFAGQNSSYNIPIVFHIFGDDFSGRLVDQAKIIQALDEVNTNFAGLNDSIDANFLNAEGSMDIEFKLAQIDPKGNTTNGIIFHEYKEGFALNGTRDEDIKKYAWDNKKYMNVYIQLVIKTGSKNKSGTAWLPNASMTDEGTARIVYNGKYLIYSPPASSLTHEVGHYLGLYHVFDNGGCTEEGGDLVEDTPPTSGGLGCGDQKNCFGEWVNSQNHMDYNSCEAMFTKGQVERMDGFMDHEARVTLWQDSNLIQTGIKDPLGARVLFNYTELTDSEVDKYASFQESSNNDGTIITRKKIKAVDGAQFTSQRSSLLAGVDFTLSSLPNGLNAKINILDSVTAQIVLEGSASSHTQADQAQIELSLNNSAFEGGHTPTYQSTGKYQVDFYDPYETKYGNLSPQLFMAWSEQNEDVFKTDYQSTLIGGNLILELVNFDGNSLALNNYDHNVEFLTHTNTNHIKFFSEGASLSPLSSGDWGLRTEINEAPPVISSVLYKDWYGKTGYVAMRIPTGSSDYLYGWLRAKVAEDGSGAYIISYAINELKNTALKTGIEAQSSLHLLGDRFVESTQTPGGIEAPLAIQLENAEFINTPSLTSTDFKVNNLPDGLTANIKVISNTQAELHLEGQTQNHDWGDFVTNLSLEIYPTAFKASHNFSSGQGSVISQQLAIEFFGESFVADANADEADNGNLNSGWSSILWSYQSIGRQVSYQFQNYDNATVNGFKFISWRKDAIADSSYQLIPLSYGDSIGPKSPWKEGREYWSGPGQHLLDSPTYTAWRKKTAYIGIRFRRSGRLHYGWIKTSVQTNGDKATFEEFGISGMPEQGLLAGTLTPIIEEDIIVANSPSSTLKVNFKNNMIHIVDSFNSIIEIELLNSKGQTILNTKEVKLNTSELPKGQYFLNIKTDSGMIQKGINIK